MNKTLSLIEEENEEEFFTNDDERVSSSQYNNQFGETRRGLHLEEDLKQINEQIEKSVSEESLENNQQSSKSSHEDTRANIPDIVKDIENMEREFTRFLELIYN